MSRQSRRATTVIAGLFIASLGASGATAASPPSTGASALPAWASDITGTARGKRLFAEAASRYAARGVKSRALRVIEDAGGILIAPATVKLTAVQVTLADGTKGRALAPVTRLPMPALATAQSSNAAALASPAWSFVANDCFTRFSDGPWAWMDHCYWMYKLSNDGNAKHDWWALQHFASMQANAPWVMNWARIRTHRYPGSPAQTWADWSPRSSWSGGSCGPVSVGVTSPVGGINVSIERCPSRWDLTKSANGASPDYTLQWTGFGARDVREMAFEIAVRVAQGARPAWTLPAEVHGSPI